ncbi:hypothetical protein ABL78_6521 [Leptomonas seymouri]|uniref:COPI associated protein n=1 Tax=Leptomonas seymouri TaxID=5684 RepID=A0A0N0P3R6_LEPSE|nr:hypothetical protein ABL78_6521 [Leptomonas seymouri]|eukprot:KPI84439.1 hypothetical protein ABL78_6521 [Leptomonas seymouri]
MQNVRNAASHVPGSQSCWQRNWPRIFLVSSLITTVLCFVSVITGLITAVIQPRLMLLSIYCLLFALLAFSAELRQFSWCRRVVYLWMRYFYFLTYYKARAIFYIMLGFLLLTSRTLDIIAAIVALALGFIMLLVALVVNLPVFEDPREQQQKDEEFRRYYDAAAPSNAAAAAAATSNQNVSAAAFGADAKTVNSNNDVQGNTQAQLSSAPTKQSVKAPPTAMSAQRSPSNANNYVDRPFHNSSDDEPAQREQSSTYSSSSPIETQKTRHPGAVTFSSGGKSGPNMFASATPVQTTGVTPPLQEAGMTRGGSMESAIRRDFAAAMGASEGVSNLR